MFGTNTAFIIARLLINLHFHKYTLPIWYICANKKIILKHDIKLKNKRLSRRKPVKILWQAKKVIESLEGRKIASKNANVVYVYVLTNWAIDLGCWFKSHWGLNFFFVLFSPLLKWCSWLWRLLSYLCPWSSLLFSNSWMHMCDVTLSSFCGQIYSPFAQPVLVEIYWSFSDRSCSNWDVQLNLLCCAILPILCLDIISIT